MFILLANLLTYTLVPLAYIFFKYERSKAKEIVDKLTEPNIIYVSVLDVIKRVFKILAMLYLPVSIYNPLMIFIIISIVIYDYIAFGRALDVWQILAIAMACISIVVITGSGIANLKSDMKYLVGIAFAVISYSAFGINFVESKHGIKNKDPFVSVFYNNAWPLVITIVLFILGNIVKLPFGDLDLKFKMEHIKPMLYTALVVYGLFGFSANILSWYSNLNLKASVFATLWSSQALFGVALGYLILKEKVSMIQLAGIIIMMISTYIAIRDDK